jgi:DNA segregation ATPase FtsK/SpoIIIE-like protein
MADGSTNRHNGGPLNDEDAQKLWGHIRALEVLEAQKEEVSVDTKARKELAKSDGFDTTILQAVLKRRKNGKGESLVYDELVKLYENALEDQGALPLEERRKQKPIQRSKPDDIAEELHGEPLPPDPFKEQAEEGEDARITADEVELYFSAVSLVRTEKRASTSWLQRQLRIGYNQAARLVERMEREKIVTAPDVTGRREVIDVVQSVLERIDQAFDTSRPAPETNPLFDE